MAEDTRRETNALFNDNKIKLGTFATNVSGAAAITSVEGVFETTWPNAVALAEIADRGGLEAIVPVARWRGFGGPTNFNGDSFETYTWAAGLGAHTKHATLFSTSHVPTVHPIVAAKQAATIDHITGGRFALNIVCGWFAPEFAMFGRPIMDHETRYAYAGEWIEIIKKLWTEEDEFDYEGKFFKIEKGFSRPKPLQKPFPALMNAGGSDSGRHFTCKYCDVAFIRLRGTDLETTRNQVDRLRDLARNEYGRDIQIWAHSYVVHRPTEKEARDFHHYYVHEKGDWEAADNLTKILGVQSAADFTPEAMNEIKAGFISGYGGFPLVGTAEQIVDLLQFLNDAGLDGTLLSFASYEEELRNFIDEVIPLTVQAGLRKA